MSKKIIAYSLLCLLIASTAGTGFVSLVKANFEPVPYPTPITDKPIITLISPAENGIIQKNDTTTIIFTVAMPQTWNWTIPYSDTPPGYLPNTEFVGTITSVTCSLDQAQILSDNNTYGNGGYFPLDHANPSNHCYTLFYTEVAGSLSLGKHDLTISVSAYTIYYPSTVNANYGGHWAVHYDVSTSTTYTFSVDAPPAITNLSVENRTYDNPVIPLVFNVIGSTSWLGYSLDNQANATVDGNVTLTDLPEGNHTLIVYANDTFGSMGKSSAAFFNVILPEPTPSPTPMPPLSSAQQPSLEPSLKTIGNGDPLGWIPYAIAALVIVGIGASVVYLKKRKK